MLEATSGVGFFFLTANLLVNVRLILVGFYLLRRSRTSLSHGLVIYDGIDLRVDSTVVWVAQAFSSYEVHF